MLLGVAMRSSGRTELIQRSAPKCGHDLLESETTHTCGEPRAGPTNHVEGEVNAEVDPGAADQGRAFERQRGAFSGLVVAPKVGSPVPAHRSPDDRADCGPESHKGCLPVLRRVPGIRMVTSYQPRWLAKDLMAGLVLTAILVPQGMAYAELAGLPAITGLYTSILCLVGYAALGPSRILVLGPDSSLGPMIAATIFPLMGASGSPTRAIALASMLAILVGATMILAGVAKLGFVADLLSKPTQIGYMTGLALTILVGQMPKLCGFSVHLRHVIGDVRGFVDGVRSGETVTAAVLVGLFGLAVILVLQRWLPKVPGVLVAVVASIGAAVLFDLAGHGVAWWVRCPRVSRRSPSRVSRPRTSDCSLPAHSGSRSSP